MQWSKNNIEKAIEEFINEGNSTREPDFIVYDNGEQFSVKCCVKGKRNTTVITGIGGFRLILKEISKYSKLFLKIQYNDVILNREQAQKLIKLVEND